MRSILALLVCASVAFATLPDLASCNKTFHDLRDQFTACEANSPLLNISTLPAAIPKFCTGSDTCDRNNLSATVGSFASSCAAFLSAEAKAFLAKANAESTALCAKSDKVYCLPNAVLVMGVVEPLIKAMDKESDEEDSAATVPFNATLLAGQLNEICSSGCIAQTYNISIALKGRIDSDKDTAETISTLLLVPTIVCMQDEGEWCFVQLMETMMAALQGEEGYEAALKLIPSLCSACGHRLISAITRLGLNEDAFEVPSWNDLCYTDDDGKSCIAKAISGIESSGMLQNCLSSGSADDDSDKCSNSMKQFIKSVGCCAYSLVPALAMEDNDTAALLAAALPAKCEQSSSAASKRALVTLGLGNVNRTALQEKWSTIKMAVAKELALILGLDAKDAYDAWIANDSAVSGGKKRADSTTASIVVDLRPSSTATTVENVETYAKQYFEAGSLQLTTLASADVAADSTQPVAVTSASTDVSTIPGSAASTLTVATAVIVAALALLF